MKIVIFGKGRVGEATAHALTSGAKEYIEVLWVDPAKNLTVSSLEGVTIAIVCVPSLEQGPYDHSVLDQTLLTLQQLNFDGITAIRSTVTPDWIIERSKTYQRLNIIHFPEFMKQHGDHINDKPWTVVLGGDIQYTELFGRFLSLCGYGASAEYVHTSAAASTLIKLGQNGFLATKVSYFNMIADTCAKYGVDYNTVRDAITADDRIGKKHTDVPGWDGQRGYGGHCLPKDLMALSRIVELCDIPASVITYNRRIRSENVQTK
jgi:UDP-glucose 6-dehydrogenase